MEMGVETPKPRAILTSMNLTETTPAETLVNVEHYERRGMTTEEAIREVARLRSRTIRLIQGPRSGRKPLTEVRAEHNAAINN